MSNSMRAVLGGGCFWCLEAVFERIRGVVSVTSGYCGGSEADANYHAVCDGRTDHAEVVAIDFDPSQISYSELLKIFFTIHDPTTLNRQGNDIGRQYRSVVFTQSDEQAEVARLVMAEIRQEQWWPHDLVTELQSAAPFFPAEPYHQGYFRNNPAQGYCSLVVAPKVAKARSAFSAYFTEI